MTATYQMDVTFTDTFAREPNYCWVRSATLEIPRGTSDREIMRRCKAAVGLTGVKGRKDYTSGDYIAFRPYGSCTIMMASVRY